MIDTAQLRIEKYLQQATYCLNFPTIVNYLVQDKVRVECAYVPLLRQSNPTWQRIFR